MKKHLTSWAPTLLWAAVLFILSAQSELPRLPLLPFNDKLAHLALYLVLGATLAWAGRDSRRGSVHVALILVGVFFALSDEWHQSFVPGREPEFGDFLADLLGVLLGYVMARRVLRFLRIR